METANASIALVKEILDLFQKINTMFAKKKKIRPCPCCRRPKAHHTKCQTYGCRTFKDYLRKNYVEVYGTLAYDSGGNRKYHEKRINGTLSDALKKLPEEKLQEYKTILQSVN